MDNCDICGRKVNDLRFFSDSFGKKLSARPKNYNPLKQQKTSVNYYMICTFCLLDQLKLIQESFDANCKFCLDINLQKDIIQKENYIKSLSLQIENCSLKAKFINFKGFEDSFKQKIEAYMKNSINQKIDKLIQALDQTVKEMQSTKSDLEKAKHQFLQMQESLIKSGKIDKNIFEKAFDKNMSKVQTQNNYIFYNHKTLKESLEKLKFARINFINEQPQSQRQNTFLVK